MKEIEYGIGHKLAHVKDSYVWASSREGAESTIEELGGDRYLVAREVGEPYEVPAVAPLPTIPGFYVADYDASPSGKILIELLNRPEGQWVDNTDSRYLDETWMRGLRNLTRLVPAQDVEVSE